MRPINSLWLQTFGGYLCEGQAHLHPYHHWTYELEDIIIGKLTDTLDKSSGVSLQLELWSEW